MAVDGLQGNEMAQPRVFAHDAISVTPSANAIANTERRGACIYVGESGTTGTLVVKMESGNTAVFKGIADGTFLPILVTHVLVSDGGSNTTDVSDILALY
jgi:hypothetical protein